MRKRFFSFAGALVLVFAGLIVGSGSAEARTIGPVTENCGIASCSLYLSRSATKKANDKLTIGGGGYAASATAVCGALTFASGPGAVVVGPACAATATFQGAWIAQEISDAATKHGPRGACLKVTKSPVTPFYWSTNNGKYCKN